MTFSVPRTCGIRMINERGRMKNDKGSRITCRNSGIWPHFPSQIPHNLSCNWISFVTDVGICLGMAITWVLYCLNWKWRLFLSQYLLCYTGPEAVLLPRDCEILYQHSCVLLGTVLADSHVFVFPGSDITDRVCDRIYFCEVQIWQQCYILQSAIKLPKLHTDEATDQRILRNCKNW